ncbi:30S ribosomal protein S16 [Flavobacteriaceae bacterium]|nr:30S ribosomal protein S16 [Flavobacteriaceae bacterium]
MPVRIRLQRHGKKGKPFYWIVAADARSKRDGRYLEKLGVYNPNTNPATVEVDLDGSVKWLESGAQPSDTARTLLSYRGVLLKHHLNGGVKKGALTQEDADNKLAAWLDEKQAKIQAKVDGLSKDKASSSAKKLQAETEIREKRISDALAADAAVEEAAAAELEATKAAEAEKAAAEAPAVEEAPVVEEAPATEVVAEAPEETPATEVVAEAAEEAPAKEDSAEAKDKE